MISTIDELESVEPEKMKALCRQLEPDDIAITLHGVSPALAKKFRRSVSLLQKIKILLSPYRKESVRIELVEKTHAAIVALYNSMIAKG
jgi:flagellar motor switch protein FliG